MKGINKIITLTLILMLLLSTAAIASSNETTDKQQTCPDGKRMERPEIDEATKEKLEELRTKLKNDEITREEFQAELKEIMPEGFHFRGMRKEFGDMEELSEEVKAKLEELKAKLKNGEITQEEFQAELKEIMPKGFRFKGMRKEFGNMEELSEEAKAKIEELKAKLKNGEITQEEFQAELKEILPEGFHFKGKGFGGKKELPEEIKTKLEELRAKLKDGEITDKEFREELKSLKQD